MQIFDYMSRLGYEQLVLCTDEAVGLRAIVAIHDTTLGPALGGCRYWSYPSEEAAITDALRLARGMTYKAAAAGLALGGGKAVIMADPARPKSEALFRSFGRFLESLGGRYITAEDVGTNSRDMEWISRETPYVTGLSQALGGSGDPSEMTAVGIYRGIQACAKAAWGFESLKGHPIALQGFGKVATYLAGHLKKEGARLIVTDIRPEALKLAKEEFEAQVVEPEAIYDADCHIFSPCALGATINRETIPRLKAAVIAGSANNQLQTPEDGDELHRRGIIYAPDYIINAGGIINISFEIGMPYDPEAAREKVEGIYQTVEQVIALSKSEGISSARAADRLAEERLRSVRSVKRLYLGHRQP